jgi:hypothetical protein
LSEKEHSCHYGEDLSAIVKKRADYSKEAHAKIKNKEDKEYTRNKR